MSVLINEKLHSRRLKWRWPLQVHNLHLPGFNAPVFQCRQQAVVGGGDKRYGDAFANQIFRFADSFLYHQRFGVTQF